MIPKVYFFALAAMAALPLRSWAGTVELHAHLFMNDGMTWGFRGDFDGPLKAKDWRQKLSSQANPETAFASGIDIMVVTLYANALFTTNLKNSIRRQIVRVRQFVADHPEWSLVKTPMEAREALAQGRRAMILALEGASGILETEEDLREFVDDGGIQIVTFLHLMDDSLGGVALMRGLKSLACPQGILRQKISGRVDENSVPLNPKGLTEKGRGLAQALIRRGVWIDLNHSSDAAQQELIPMLIKAGQPLLYTHGVLRRHYKVEREIADWQIEAVRATRGIIGLLPSEELFENGIFSLVEQYNEVAAVIGSDSVMLGTDFNGGMQHLKPRCCTGTGFDQEGFWNIGQVPVLWQAMANLGAAVPSPLSRMTERFLDAWSRAQNAKNN